MPPVAVEALAGVALPDRVSIAATKSVERATDTQRIGVARTDEAIRARFEGDRLAVDNQRVGSSERLGNVAGGGQGRQQRRRPLALVGRARQRAGAPAVSVVLTYAPRCGAAVPVNAALIGS